MNRFAVALALFLAPAAAFADDVAVIVGFHGGADGGIFARHGGSAGTDLGGLNAHSGTVPAARLEALRSEPGVAYVEEDLVRSGTITPNDTYYVQYQADDFGLINSPAAWGVSTGAGVRVAVLDTGCYMAHADIGSNSTGKAKAWRNFTSTKPGDVKDADGHGSHTAGTVGAKTNNGYGVASAGYNCELAIGKVLNNAGRGSDSTVAAGIDWAWKPAVKDSKGFWTGGGAKIISMSLGGPGASTTLENAINAAWAGGAVIVAAAGNDAVDAKDFYPAASTNCISVAATTNTGALASFSNFGPSVDIAAPGVSILSTGKTSGMFAFMSGTSMACPHVSGTAALVWSAAPGASNATIRDRLKGSATQAVTADFNLLDAYAAVTSSLP